MEITNFKTHNAYLYFEWVLSFILYHVIWLNIIKIYVYIDYRINYPKKNDVCQKSNVDQGKIHTSSCFFLLVINWNIDSLYRDDSIWCDILHLYKITYDGPWQFVHRILTHLNKWQFFIILENSTP